MLAQHCWALFHSAIGGCKRQIYHLPNVSSFLPRRALREQLVYRLIAIAVGRQLPIWDKWFSIIQTPPHPDFPTNDPQHYQYHQYHCQPPPT